MEDANDSKETSEVEGEHYIKEREKIIIEVTADGANVLCIFLHALRLSLD